MTDMVEKSRILVIDDDEAVRLSLTYLLRAKGYDVATAGNGASGFEQLETFRPQIVLSDMVMPGPQGAEIIRRIHEFNPAIAIVAMSGSVEGGGDGFLGRARNAGAVACLEKPFEAADLLALLESFAGGEAR